MGRKIVFAAESYAGDQCENPSLAGSVLDVLSFAVENHTYHVKNYILSKELLQKVSEIDINKEIKVTMIMVRLTEHWRNLFFPWPLLAQKQMWEKYRLKK